VSVPGQDQGHQAQAVTPTTIDADILSTSSGGGMTTTDGTPIEGDADLKVQGERMSTGILSPRDITTVSILT